MVFIKRKAVIVMPGFDGTGPMGRGAMTGGGRGFCAVNAVNVEDVRISGGFYGRGRCRGMRNRFGGAGVPGCVRGRKGMGFGGGRGRWISEGERPAQP